MKEYPLISCLCPSENRAGSLKTAITCFFGQTYPNKELVIASRGFNPEYQSLIASFQHPGIRYFWDVPPTVTLGDLRNHTIERSEGQYWCVWDDDDWHHRERLAVQYQAIVQNKKDACVLIYNLIYNQKNGRAYMSRPLNMPGTILCKKNVLRYPSLEKAEDNQMLKEMYSKNMLIPIVDPTLYIYVCHGSNTSDNAILDYILGTSQELSKSSSRKVLDALNNKNGYERSCEALRNTKLMQELNYCWASDIFG